jgi:hypothetical protein
MQQNSDSGVLPVFFHLRWVSNIALSVGVLAAIALLLELFLITDGKGTEYGRIIVAHSLTRENLGPAITVFGLVMTILASLIAWLVSLYGSFRVAGPLFRLSQNMKNAIEHPSRKPVRIRQGDMLQREWQEFEASLSGFDQHCRRLGETLDDLKQALAPDAGADLGAAREALTRLEEVERLVQL